MDSKIINEPPDLSKYLSIYISEEENIPNDSPKDEENKDNGVSVQEFLNGLSETTITPINNYEDEGVSSNSTANKNSFTTYFARFGPSNGKYCEKCKKYFSKVKFATHLRTHTGERPFSCDMCNKTFNRPDKLSLHRCSHWGHKSHACVCGRNFTRLHYLKSHLVSHHTLSTEFKDKILEYAKEEMENKVIAKGLLKCPYCSLSYPGKYKLSRHIRTHTGDKPYACPCGVKFTRNEHLKKHRLCKSCPFNTIDENSTVDPLKVVESSVDLIKQEVKDYDTQTMNGKTEEKNDSITVGHTDVAGKSITDNPAATIDERLKIARDQLPVVAIKQEQLEDTDIAMMNVAGANPRMVQKNEKAMLNDTWKKFAKNIKAHVCEYCNKVFSKNHKLNIHRRIHTGERPYSCDTCGKGFSRKDHLLKHTNVHLKYRKATSTFYMSQLMINDFTNSKCNSSYQDIKTEPDVNVSSCKSSDLLYEDMKIKKEFDQVDVDEQLKDVNNAKSICLLEVMKHELDKADVNDQLNESENTSSNMNIFHQQLEEQKIHYCPICNHGFKKYYNFQSHLETHGDREIFKCPICIREFKVKKNFEAHLLNHETKLEETSMDSTITNDYIELAKLKRAQCPICKKWLVSQSSLIMHMRSHTGEKPHHCETCDRYFVRKADMMRHRRRHTGENLFICTICDVSYTRRDKLAAHVRRNHPEPADAHDCTSK